MKNLKKYLSVSAAACAAFAACVLSASCAGDEDADVFFNGKTNYEIRIRLISSDGYICYYVGLLDKTKSVDFLLDGETGEILAKKK